jgi:hypothetical protein
VFANRFALFVQPLDARGRLTEGRSMDRDLGKPKKSQASPGMLAGLAYVPAGLPMKQTPKRLRPTAPARHKTLIAVSSKAHDKDGMFNKEIYR